VYIPVGGLVVVTFVAAYLYVWLTDIRLCELTGTGVILGRVSDDFADSVRRAAHESKATCTNEPQEHPIHFQCPTCEVVIQAPFKSAGTIVDCPTCQARVRVPDEEEIRALEQKKAR
jgi:hypothetical protein